MSAFLGLDHMKYHPLVVCAKPPVQLRLVVFRCINLSSEKQSKEIKTKPFLLHSKSLQVVTASREARRGWCATCLLLGSLQSRVQSPAVRLQTDRVSGFQQSAKVPTCAVFLFLLQNPL